MDEVKAMTHAGETVGRAVGTGLRTLRRGAVQVAAAAEHKLAEGAETVRDAAAETQIEIGKTSRKARKQLARDAKGMAKSAKRARKHAGRAARDVVSASSDLLTSATQAPSRRGRTLPWLLGIGIAAAGAGTVYVLRNRQHDKPSAAVQDDNPDRIGSNGSAPQPRHEQPVDSPTSHLN